MSRIVPEVWSRLTGGQVQAEALWARRAAPETTDRLLAAVDAGERRHFLMLLEPSDPDIHDEQSRGLALITRQLAIPEHAPGRYVDIVCHDAAGHDAFDLIGGELADRLSANRETPAECVVRVLAKWRRFWGQAPRQLLSREQQLGLFAELWFLSVWLLPRVGPAESVGRWRGPFGARHDFEWSGRSVEVKATTSNRGVVHRIHGVEQLLPPESGDLLFFSLRLREEAGANNTLPGLVASCGQQFVGYDEARSAYESALMRAGYSQTHEEEYAKMRLRVAAEGLYAVQGDFPSLTPSHFPAGVPPGVENIVYDVNLEGFERHRIAEGPSDNFEL